MTRVFHSWPPSTLPERSSGGSMPRSARTAAAVATTALLQAVVATAAAVLADRGIEPPLLRSGNVDGGHEWNTRVMDRYADRIFYRH